MMVIAPFEGEIIQMIILLFVPHLEVVEESNPQQRVLRRLFRYSFSDWKLILLGSFFLFIVSSGKSIGRMCSTSNKYHCSFY